MLIRMLILTIFERNGQMVALPSISTGQWVSRNHLLLMENHDVQSLARTDYGVSVNVLEVIHLHVR